ncbi:MAG: precorrin-3B C(17)-methyltransferase [Oscillospiraceae bacterium]|nr:precorrin-3B C(17)-methyltransferase [Oscillospiraceae bacterium]
MANKLYIVGLGPGGEGFMTAQARAALEAAEVLCGYTVYIDLVAHLFPEKETYTTPMRRELDRCRWALETAAGGRTVALVCSGDAGVYGMAGPALQLAAQWPDVEIEVVAGVTAALSGGAVLGAPLGHDFCVISLSDLLTPWEVIEQRLRCAAMGDFSICLYNPASHKRKDYLQKACDILLAAGKDPETVCGYVRNIGRDGEEGKMVSLAQLRGAALDMFTTVFIGSSTTLCVSGRMVTPRGYERKQGPCA